MFRFDRMSTKPEPSAPRILIVDDDPGQRSLLTTFLERHGHRPLVADSGEAALRQLAAAPVSLMISDVRMPGLTGLETLRRACPCAGCKGEVDIMGNLYKNPDKPYAANAFQLTGLALVGGYGVQPAWADGHNSGIFAFDYLKRVAETAAN